MQVKHYRALWLSDIHLGNLDCKAEYLLHFLEHVRVDTLYLVGDIIDMWQLTKQFRWPDSHNQVLHKFIKMREAGTRIIYLPGNHDAPLQSYSGMTLADIEIQRQLIHTTAAGKKYLVMHGDQCDGDVALGKFHAWIGDKGYDLLLFLNRWYHRFLQWRKQHYWSLASYIKRHIAGANAAIERYQHACCQRARARGVEGVICGHIHHPQSIDSQGTHYVNTGDWVEHCSAIVEHESGRLELLHWVEQMRTAHPVYPFPATPKTKQVA